MVGSGDKANADKSSSFGASSVCCSICLDLVTDNGGRSRAKLQCSHEFHLDCIGSAFNMKGTMQCPNCRKVEGGRWLYSNGSARLFPELGMDELTPDEDPYELSYSEMPFRVHWCPFSGFTRVHSSFEEVEPPSTASHSYVAYLGSVLPASSNSNESVDNPNFNYRWTQLNGIYTGHASPTIDIQYQSWARHSPPFSANNIHINGADQAAVPPASMRSARGETDAITRSGPLVHPFLYGLGNPRPYEGIQVSHVIHPQQQPSNTPGMPSSVVPGVRRFSGLPPFVPPASQSDHGGGFYIFPASGLSGRNLHEAENPLLNHFHAWERDQLPRFPITPFDRDLGWGAFRHAHGGSDSGSRSGSFWQRHWS